MQGNYEVCFEMTDSFISAIDTDAKYDEIINAAKKLCEVFDFEFELKKASAALNDTPNLMFSIFVYVDFITYPHYFNVLTAFAQEYQLLISNAFYIE